MKRRILIVDDHPVVCQGLSQLINQEADLTVCGHAASAAQGLASARSLQPDLLIVDLSLKGSSGLDLIKDMHIFMPNLPILVLSMHDETIYAERALRAGARGYLMKQESTECIFAAIRRLLSGQFYVSEAMNSRMIRNFANGQGAASTEASAVDKLSDRELQVFQQIGEGRSTRQIAEKLCISVKTVETHRAHLKEKLQLDNAPELTRFALEWVRCQSAC
jgi:DNA-binding NarL/FixJ family response regulator